MTQDLPEEPGHEHIGAVPGPRPVSGAAEPFGADPPGESGARLTEAIAAEESSHRRERERHDPYGALRLANYRHFAAGYACSSTGLRMMSVAVGWEVYDRFQDDLEGGAFALGLVGLVRAAPVLLLALPAGYLIDLIDRKKVLIATQAGFAAAVLLLAAASAMHAPLWVLYALIGFTGCVRVFNGPSRAVLLPQIVPPGLFQNAVTWNSGATQFSAMIGPILAGALIEVTGEAWPVYAATALFCAMFAVTAAFIQPRPAAGRPDRVSFLGMFQGMKHVWREKTVLAVISLDLFAVLLGGATALMPIYARDILHVGPSGLGALNAAPYVGAFLMALLLAHRPPFRRAGLTLLLAVAGFGAATVAFGLSRSFPLSLAMLGVLGALDNISVVIRHVLVQIRTPDHLRGRVSSVNSVFIESSNELGAFESGAVAAQFGPVISVVSGGVGTILVVIGIALALPQIRTLGALQEAEIRPRRGGTRGTDAPEAAGTSDRTGAPDAA